MGTPKTIHSYHDALGDLGGLLVPAHIRHFFIKPIILDVGAGWGKYRQLLPEFEVDAVEIWEPYIREEDLTKKYRKVFNVDICNLHEVFYDVIIMGDVLEHIERSKAIRLIEKLKNSCTQLYIIVPYQYHQDEVNGNKYEIHLQEDLTDDLIKELYSVNLLAKDDLKGIYVK